MTEFLSWVGSCFLIAAVAGIFIPGVEFHIYFGTKEGAIKWHEEKITKSKPNKEPDQ